MGQQFSGYNRQSNVVWVFPRTNGCALPQFSESDVLATVGPAARLRGLTDQDVSAKFNLLNSRIRQGVDPRRLFLLFLGLFFLIPMITIFTTPYSGNDCDDVNEECTTFNAWYAVLPAVIIVLFVGTMCRVIMSQNQLRAYVNTECFADWEQRGALLSAMYWQVRGTQVFCVRSRSPLASVRLASLPLINTDSPTAPPHTYLLAYALPPSRPPPCLHMQGSRHSRPRLQLNFAPVNESTVQQPQGYQQHGTVISIQPAHTQMMSVTVPVNAVSGSLLTVQTPSGQSVQVAVPDGMEPGMQFNIQLPQQAPAPAPMVQAVAQPIPVSTAYGAQQSYGVGPIAPPIPIASATAIKQ